ncbi:hypothetical protein ACLK1U_19365 [Escherichia coli]
MSSDFQLIAGTVPRFAPAGCRRQISRRSVRADQSLDLHPAKICQRQEDIEPNLDYEVERHATLTGDSVRFNTEARRAWLAFATSPQATWRGNFRELSASVARMATFATSGRITLGRG